MNTVLPESTSSNVVRVPGAPRPLGPCRGCGAYGHDEDAFAHCALCASVEHTTAEHEERVERECREREALVDAIASRFAPEVVPSSGETVAKYVERWLKTRTNGTKTDDAARLRDHVLPVLGELDAATSKREDVERLVESLDAKIEGETLDWQTALNVWRIARKLCSDMAHSKRRDLRVRRDDPAAGVRGPDRGVRKQKQVVFPSEFLAFVSCERGPLFWRRLVTIAIYTLMRDGELRALRWSDVDLEHRLISLTKAWDRKAKRVKPTKTGETRNVRIHANLLPLLRAMHDEAGGEGHVLDLARARSLARGLQRWLRHAGVERDALYESTKTSKPITFHDLRATGATWAAVEGLDPMKIQARGGWKTIEMVLRYVRCAESLADGFGVPFPPLPSTVTDSAERDTGSAKRATGLPERDTGLEPATFGLGSRRSTN